MSELLIGALAILAGLLFCFRGRTAMRVVIAIWAGFAGFYLGQLLWSRSSGEPIGSTGATISGIVLGLAFAALSYLFYVASVLIAVGSIGLTLGAAATAATGVTNRPTVLIVGLVCAIALVVLALTAHLPDLILIAFSAATGAAAVVVGVLVVLGRADAATMAGRGLKLVVDANGWLGLAWALLTIAGIVVQWRLGAWRDFRLAWPNRRRAVAASH